MYSSGIRILRLCGHHAILYSLYNTGYTYTLASINIRTLRELSKPLKMYVSVGLKCFFFLKLLSLCLSAAKILQLLLYTNSTLMLYKYLYRATFTLHIRFHIQT